MRALLTEEVGQHQKSRSETVQAAVAWRKMILVGSGFFARSELFGWSRIVAATARRQWPGA
jgi:hypothetical protein